VTPTRLLLCLSVVLLALWGAANVTADSVTDRLRPEIERVLQTLDDPTLKPATKAPERRQALREVTDGLFDWAEMAHRALGSHWDARSEAERAEFAELFRGLIERAYLAKLERYGGEKIAYAGESVEGEQATVRTRVLTRQGEVAIDYRLSARGDRWLIYDVVVDGISIAANYRAQFNEVLTKFSYQELVKRIRARVS
jgi:phospholipid transport system substrate-binding protein